MIYSTIAPTPLLHIPLPIRLGIKKPAGIFAFTPDDKLLLTVHKDEGGILWDLTLIKRPRKLDFKQDNSISRQPITSAGLLGEQRGFILGFGNNHPAQHHEIVDESPGFRVSKHTLPAANDVAISRDGRTIAFSTGSSIEIWDGTTIELKRVLLANAIPSSPFEKVVISGDSRHAAAVNATGQLTVWGIDDDFYKVSPNQEFGLNLGKGWQPVGVGLDHIFAIAALRQSAPPGGQANWTLVTWGFAYQGPDRTLYHKDFPPCALACVPPIPDFNIMLNAQGRVMGSDMTMFPLYFTDKGASKKGKVVSCSISGSANMLAVARSNGNLTVWKLHLSEASSVC
ncbi:putative wd-40 repeat-containing serine threonine protein kinase protein [Rosellinia necatrix]|uniref:Putative wd-40 repeat-containing serine threonine protein kinase protein n=1 Tax=Rosellinia necatrix TaxID=77044 RepID=A0A1W2TBM6_ROSNE|nr:putative wd-40 repeat-containing serine threonine protein kinase protein [Rosellinia necatrix]